MISRNVWRIAQHGKEREGFGPPFFIENLCKICTRRPRLENLGRVQHRKISKFLLSDSPTAGIDAISGEPIFQYLKLLK
jgi:hypothetical protein